MPTGAKSIPQVRFRIILLKPTAEVDFGLQKGKGVPYQTIQKQRSSGQDLRFEFEAGIRKNAIAPTVQPTTVRCHVDMRAIITSYRADGQATESPRHEGRRLPTSDCAAACDRDIPPGRFPSKGTSDRETRTCQPRASVVRRSSR